jgi:signal transduction histidine kinase
MSLRTRLFATYSLVVVLCLGLIAISVAIILQSSRDRLTMDRLDTIARPISVQITTMMRRQISLGEILDNLVEQAEKNKVNILLVDGEGKIQRQFSPGQTGSQPTIKVLPGELPSVISEPVQGKFVAENGQTYIFAAYPFVRPTGASDAQRIETLVLSVPRTRATAIIAGMFSPFFIAGLIALAISLILAVLFARSIYRPIHNVTKAAMSIAQGHYDQEVPLQGPREVKDLAASFNQMSLQVKKSQQQLRHFVADVSHQLKSPLTSIQGFAQAMLDGTATDGETRTKAAQIINDESQRMRHQVDELLELARMQAGQLKINREGVDMKELLEHCLEIFTVQAEEKGIAFKMKVEAALEVVGDFDRLEQVFSNLLDNAIKNSPLKGEVLLDARQVQGGLVEVRILDSGPGIPPEQLPYVFERFYQAGGMRTGVGLGLAIAREIVLAHGGNIEASSSPGEGAEFTVRLPLADRG